MSHYERLQATSIREVLEILQIKDVMKLWIIIDHKHRMEPMNASSKGDDESTSSGPDHLGVIGDAIREMYMQ